MIPVCLPVRGVAMAANWRVGPYSVVLRASGDGLQLILGELLRSLPEIREHHQRVEIGTSLDELDAKVTRDSEAQLIADGPARIGKEFLAE